MHFFDFMCSVATSKLAIFYCEEFILITYLYFVSASTATRFQLNFHSNSLRAYVSRPKHISS